MPGRRKTWFFSFNSYLLMKLLKKHPVLGLVNDFLIDSPLPANITYLWNTGSLLGLILIIQIVTGITLAMHYTPSTLYAFASLEHIMRDVNSMVTALSAC